MGKTPSPRTPRRYETPTFEMGRQIKEFLATARPVGGEQARPKLLPGRSRARAAAEILAKGRAEPENDVWRALVALDHRAAISTTKDIAEARKDPRMQFLLLKEMGRTTKEGMDVARKARREFPKEWRRIRDELSRLPDRVDGLRVLMTWMPRDMERRELLVDVKEIAEKLVEWFDELAPAIQRGAPRPSVDDPARGFAGVVFASLKQHGFTTSDLLELVTESRSVWQPPPIGPSRMRELASKRKLRDLVTALVREGAES